LDKWLYTEDVRSKIPDWASAVLDYD
jgi:hypothetical protein